MYPELIILEKDVEKRNRAVDEMTEQEAKEFLKKLLNAMNGGGRADSPI